MAVDEEDEAVDEEDEGVNEEDEAVAVEDEAVVEVHRHFSRVHTIVEGMNMVKKGQIFDFACLEEEWNIRNVYSVEPGYNKVNGTERFFRYIQYFAISKITDF